MKVFANGLEVSAKSQDCKVVGAFPDVCFTPPQTPGTPPGVPVPYPNFGMDRDLTAGSGTVKIGGKEISQENRSKLSKCTGDEAGCAPKKGVVTSNNTGAIYAQKWSMDVKVEGMGVVRFGDLATSNHSSNPGNTAPACLIGQTALPEGSDPIYKQCRLESIKIGCEHTEKGSHRFELPSQGSWPIRIALIADKGRPPHQYDEFKAEVKINHGANCKKGSITNLTLNGPGIELDEPDAKIEKKLVYKDEGFTLDSSVAKKLFKILFSLAFGDITDHAQKYTFTVDRCHTYIGYLLWIDLYPSAKFQLSGFGFSPKAKLTTGNAPEVSGEFSGAISGTYLGHDFSFSATLKETNEDKGDEGALKDILPVNLELFEKIKSMFFKDDSQKKEKKDDSQEKEKKEQSKKLEGSEGEIGSYLELQSALKLDGTFELVEHKIDPALPGINSVITIAMSPLIGIKLHVDLMELGIWTIFPGLCTISPGIKKKVLDLRRIAAEGVTLQNNEGDDVANANLLVQFFLQIEGNLDVMLEKKRTPGDKHWESKGGGKASFVGTLAAIIKAEAKLHEVSAALNFEGSAITKLTAEISGASAAKKEETGHGYEYKVDFDGLLVKYKREVTISLWIIDYTRSKQAEKLLINEGTWVESTPIF